MKIMKIKNCPFCDAEISVVDVGCMWVQCPKCHACGPQQRNAPPESVIRQWNTRISSKPKEAQTLEEILDELALIYPWVDIEVEMSKIKGWALLNPSRRITKRFVVNWFNKVQRPLKLDPENARSPSNGSHPSYNDVKTYADQKRWSAGFARHCYDTWVANGWKHFGKPITSTEQWQAIMKTMEYRT